MSDKKQLNEEQLKKVSGGVQIGENRIVECEYCKGQFDPDTVQRGPDQIETGDNSGYIQATYKCPYCNEFHRVKVIQVKQEDLTINNISFIF